MDKVYIVINLSSWDDSEAVVGVSGSMERALELVKAQDGERLRLEVWSLEHNEQIDQTFFHKDGSRWYRKDYI